MSKEMLSVRPDLPIIITTGYNSVVKAEEIKTCGVREVTHEPLMKKDLAGVIRNALEGRSAFCA